MAHNKTRDDVDITKEDLHQIGEALKKEDFRNLLNNYFEEINDPKNKAIFQEELTEFEKQRGVDVTFINPEPGYVIKSSIDGNRKAFINICSNKNVDKPSSTVASKNGAPGLNWSIPYLQGQPRDDLDNKNECCLVYDVIFHPDTLYLGMKNVQIKKLIDDIALTAVEDSFKVKLDRKNIVFPKLRYKGCIVATIIRKRRSDYVEEDLKEDIVPGCPYPYPSPPKENIPKETLPRGNYDNDDSVYTIPHYILKHRREIDMQEFTYSPDAKFHAAIPSHLIIEIDLPLIRSAVDVKLDVLNNSLSLISEKPAKYKLKMNLPYNVDDENGNAKFDKKKKKLIVTLPVNRCSFPRRDFTREDSGIESDPNHNNCSSSEEDIRKNVELLQVSDESVNSEILSKNVSLLMRASEEVKNQFLNPEIHYSLPTYTIATTEILTVKMIVKNIDPRSVAHQFLEDNNGVHIKFFSLGAGFFPVHYAFCLKILGVLLETTSMKIDVWDNCLTATLRFNEKEITSYFVGISLDSMEKKELHFSENCSEVKQVLIENLKNSTESKKLENYCGAEDNSTLILKRENEKAVEELQLIEEQTEDSGTSRLLDDRCLSIEIFKNRTLSESSELPDSFGCGKRSILKGSRSLSESHTDDYNTWSSLDSESHDDLTGSKKTVRFSDVVSKKIFRANSSILGQKKKNEKKSRNRKKAAYERMLSAGSEESETDREECDSVSELSDLSSDDSYSGTSSSVNIDIPSSKKHRRRGAKNQRKAAATAKHNHLPD